ncbi:hypothetical protein MRB53_020704 [Persea americana]|uniref:Uncharacterized protein n=1 Tax=Persea americana TaxID=3435 RepID=A0ACC2L205_PERAE|nr:hypothetical protein MRB53_020704 [Persea americana]
MAWLRCFYSFYHSVAAVAEGGGNQFDTLVCNLLFCFLSLQPFVYSLLGQTSQEVGHMGGDFCPIPFPRINTVSENEMDNAEGRNHR